MQLQLPQIMEVKGFRVLTTRQLAEAYGTEIKVIQNNFQRNKDRYVAGKHYIYMDSDELREVKTTHPQFEGELKRTSKMHFWTEKGALLHAKSLNTDKAWEVYDYLVDFYFRANEKAVPEAKPEPVKKPSGREVVDVPENIEIQKALTEVRKYISALDVVTEEFNKYKCKENYLHIRYAMDMLWISLGRKITDLEDISPKIVVKEGYQN